MLLETLLTQAHNYAMTYHQVLAGHRPGVEDRSGAAALQTAKAALRGNLEWIVNAALNPHQSVQLDLFKDR